MLGRQKSEGGNWVAETQETVLPASQEVDTILKRELEAMIGRGDFPSPEGREDRARDFC